MAIRSLIYWDFGDGNFGTNGPIATKVGRPPVNMWWRCVVTDMKGGEASKSLVVTIGSPTTYRINGYVGTGSAPVQNVRVYVSTTRMAWTDSEWHLHDRGITRRHLHR
jgi:hypothetical protein